MNTTQRNIITGSLLGDGYLTRLKKHPTWNWGFAKKQSKCDIRGIDKISYLKYHQKQLSEFCRENIYLYKHKEKTICNNKKPTPESWAYHLMTRTNVIFTQLGKKWYTINNNNELVKIIPKNLTLTPLSLCIWYMDDGSKEIGKNRCRIATNCFTHEEVNFLTWLIGKRFGISARVIENYCKKPMIEIGGFDNYKKLYDVISPEVKWDCYQHKLEQPKPITCLAGDNHPQCKLTEITLKKIYALYQAGMTQTEISTKYNVKPNTISTALSKCKFLKNLNLGTRGERNGKAKLAKKQVEEIRSLFATISCSKLMELYSVSKSTIYNIIRNKTWIF